MTTDPYTLGNVRVPLDLGRSVSLDLSPREALNLAISAVIAVTSSVRDTGYDLTDHLDAITEDLAHAATAFGRNRAPNLETWHPDAYRTQTLPQPDVDKDCDGYSVGVIITDPQDRILMIERVNAPAGIAPPAGHIDEHGTAEDTARAEVCEETGLTITSLDLLGRWRRSNVCRRRHLASGPGHDWTVYTAQATGTLTAQPDETRNPRWYTRDELQDLAYRTVSYAYGLMSDAEFAAAPGLEPVWADFLYTAGRIQLLPGDLSMINKLACRSPYHLSEEGHQ
ncbi:NUDIX hydrolase [Dactylosporangium sp. CA-139066]|uniref:NUDIX hydrolase n=1 Tax=Dactylosporangium sp. CA-139066 TaxID=3239930 RepID=UPI003D93F039